MNTSQDKARLEERLVKQAKVLGAIMNERQHQDAKWGHPDVRPHEVGAWLALMDVHLQRAQAAWANARNDDAAIHALRKALAVGVACGEQHGLPPRNRLP